MKALSGLQEAAAFSLCLHRTERVTVPSKGPLSKCHHTGRASTWIWEYTIRSIAHPFQDQPPQIFIFPPQTFFFFFFFKITFLNAEAGKSGVGWEFHPRETVRKACPPISTDCYRQSPFILFFLLSFPPSLHFSTPRLSYNSQINS